MPRKKKHGKQGGSSGASSKHPKHAKNAGARAGGKGSKKVDKEGTPSQKLQQLQEMFEGKLDAALVHAIMEDHKYDVDLALETLFKLAGDVPDLPGSDVNGMSKAPRDLVSYSESDESDDSEDPDDFLNGLYPPHHVASEKTIARSRTDQKQPVISRNGVGLDDISLPGIQSSIKGLDLAISMAKDLDRNTFSEESVEKVTAGLMAYRDTGDRNKLVELGNLSAIAEMVLEVGVKEEEKQEMESSMKSSKVQFKSLHSRLPVYSATDDRLVGGMSSSSGSSVNSSPNDSDNEDQPDGAFMAKNTKSKSESKEKRYEAAGSEDCSGNAMSNWTPLTVPNAPMESVEKPQENLSLNNSDMERQLKLSTNPNFSNTINHTQLSTSENRHEEVASARPKATVSFLNNLTDEQGDRDDGSGEDSEKDIDKHISFQEDSVSFAEVKPERDSKQVRERSERSNLLKSQQKEQQQSAKPNNTTDRLHSAFPPEREQLDNPFSVEIPLKQADERFSVNEIRQGAMNVPSVSSQQRPNGQPHSPVQVENNLLYPQYRPVNASPTAKIHGQNKPKTFAYDANFMPGFGYGTTHFVVKNITPGLLPRSYHKDSSPQSRSSQPWPNQGYTRAFVAHVPSRTGARTGAYPPHVHHMGKVFGFQGPHLHLRPHVPRSNVTITELPESPEEPLASTNVEQELAGPPRWPVIQHTNLKRNEYPAPSPKTIPPLPPGKVLCLMRGCPGSGKSFVAKSLKGNGVILSTDDFFMVNGKYLFDRNAIGEAHDWNQKRAQDCLEKGITPVIIDNTNIHTWEMKPYVVMALKHQYHVVIREPDTPWKHKAGELTKRNSHGVPRVAIARMLQNYDPNVTVESILNSPDKKKTPEYIDSYDREGPDIPKGDGQSPRKSGQQKNQVRKQEQEVSHRDDARGGASAAEEGWETVGGHNKGNQRNRTRGGRDARKDLNQRNIRSGHHNDQVSKPEREVSHQDDARGGDSATEEGWETVGGHHKGNHRNRARGGRDARKDLNQRNNLKSGSPRRYNNEHHGSRYQTDGSDGMRSSGRPNSAPYNGPYRVNSPSHSPSPKDRGGMRNDGPQCDNEGWVSAPKRGKRTGGGSHSPSPNRGLEKRRNINVNQRGQQHNQHNKPSDAAIRFLESEDSLSQDPMKRLMNDIGLASSTLASSSNGKEMFEDLEKNGKVFQNDEPETLSASLVTENQAQPETVLEDPMLEVTIDEIKPPSSGSMKENTRLSSSDDQRGNSSASASSMPEDPALGSDKKMFEMLLAENIQGNVNRSVDMSVTGKVDISVDITMDRSIEGDIPVHSHAGDDKNINTRRDPIQCDDLKTEGDNSVKEIVAEHTQPLNVNVVTNQTEAHDSKTTQKSIDGNERIDGECHTSCQEEESDCGTSTGSPHIPLQEPEDKFECTPRTKPEVTSPLTKEGEVSNECPRASTPALKRTSRRLSGGKSSRRLAAVFTSPTSTTPPVSENTDWSKFDPLRSIPKPTFPVCKEESKDVEVSQCDISTETSGQDFAFLQRIISGTIESQDLPQGYLCRTAVARLLNSSDKGSSSEADKDNQDRSSPIPVSLKLNKSCMTEEIIEETCDLEDEKLSMMQGCFPASSTKDLKSLLETCSGDVEMATNILLDSLAQSAANSPEDRGTPGYVSTNATAFSESASVVSGNKDKVTNDSVKILQEQDVRIGTNMEGARTEVRASSSGNPVISQRMNNETKTDVSSSRIDALNKLASDSQRFASELKQANQIIFSNNLKTSTEYIPETAHCRPGNAGSNTNDTAETTTTNDKTRADGTSNNDSELHKQEEETDSDEFEYFNNFYSGTSQLIKPKSAMHITTSTTSDELPMLESFIEDRQMLHLAAACHSPDNAAHGLSLSKPDPPVPSQQPSETLAVTTKQVTEDTIKPDLQTDDCVAPQTKPDFPVTESATIEGTKPCVDEITLVSEPESHRVDEEGSTYINDLQESRNEEKESSGSRVDEDGSTYINDLEESRNKEKESSRTSPSNAKKGSKESLSQDPLTNDHTSGNSSPQQQQHIVEQPEGDTVDNLLNDIQSLKQTSADEMSDSDIPWKAGYDVIKPEADGLLDEGNTMDKFAESGEGVYDYLGGMVLQMDAAFALQLQELFGQVGFHLDPDMLSPDDLKVKIGYQVAKQLHTAWSSGLEQRFQDQERQVDEMLQRDEELARRLQQEENLKKLAKAHRDKKPTKFVSPGSPKRNKRRQKEPEPNGAIVNGGQDPKRGEQVLVGGGLRNLGEMGAVGRAEPGKYPPPVQRMEVPELAQIMAEEELKQEREKKGVWNSPSPVRANTIATKLKRDQLFEAFPDVDRKALDEIFIANNYDLRATEWEVNAVYRECTDPVKDVFSPEALEEMEKRRESSPARRKGKGQSDRTDGHYQSTEKPAYEDYRAEATLHFKQRDECFKKAAKAYHSGQKELAVYYSNQGRLHSMKLKEANRRAAEMMLKQRKHETGANKLDLHNLHVEEALEALQEVLFEREEQIRHGTPQRYLEVVTGRGRHSKGGVARLKPAVEKFLEQKGYRFTTPNAGCLRVYFSP
ncbi:uncharacterized protein LOC121431528 [Lytechinus variegatus]|uniref:uncharacterized protein LOC121431528 n=1 Tax=Lytechinus variegatus TaxID=7654 RepID=UPI001BB14944|nr:uncharacterized protein LOC121431528 [Lytechinus variegatus]